MKDQVDALHARACVPAVALTSHAGAEEQREIIEGIRAGMSTLIYVAPERFLSLRFLDALGCAGRHGQQARARPEDGDLHDLLAHLQGK